MSNDIPRDSIEVLTKDIKEAIDLAIDGGFKSCETEKIGNFLLISEYVENSLIVYSSEEKLSRFQTPNLGYLIIDYDKKVVTTFSVSMGASSHSGISENLITQSIEPRFRAVIHLIDAFYAARLSL